MDKLFKYPIFIFIFIFVFHTYSISQEKMKIAVVPKSGGALFWKSAYAGTKMGAMALKNVEIIWKAPQSESDKEQQISIINQCIEEKVSGIILSPIDFDGLFEPVTKAMNNKIPVLIFDSPLKGKAGKDYISFVGINNKKAGELAGEHLSKLLKGKGKIVLLRHVKGQANTSEREEGFIKKISQYPNIQLIVKDKYAGGNSDKAKEASIDILKQYKDIDGIFCANETTTIGMLNALQEAKIAGKIKFVGFDTPSIVIQALKNGEINALIAQDPARMGYQSVKTLVDYIRGKKS